MRDPGDILFNDDLTPEEFEAFRIGLSERPKSRAELSRGVGLLRAVHHRIESALPDRRLLVYEALRRAGREDALDRSERLSLEESRETLDLVLRRHPGVNDVVDGVTRDVSLFEDAWNGEFGTSTTTDRLRSNGFAEGRPPRRHGSHSGRSPLLRWSWRVTAAIAVVVFVAVAVLVGQRENGLISIATLEGETRLVELADGSRVHLLPNSTLSYHADDRDAGFTRFARLEGDGFFEIARDREGFTIEASTAVVVVLGTSFGIRASDEQAEIYLASGRLSVAARDSRGQSVVLSPGEMTRVRQGSLPDTPTPTEIIEALEWTGFFVFNETPIQLVAERWEALSGVELEIDQRLEDATLTGPIERVRPLEALHTIASALGAQVVQMDDGYLLAAR